MIRRRKPVLYVLRSRTPSEPEMQDFFARSEMSAHEILVFLSLSPDEQGRRFADWQARALDREIRELGRVAEVISEDAYRALPWRCRWNREVEFFE